MMQMVEFETMITVEMLCAYLVERTHTQIL